MGSIRRVLRTWRIGSRACRSMPRRRRTTSTALVGGSRAAEQGRRVRRAPSRRPHRTRRRAPPVPHRNRHAVARSARRAGDRPRLLAGGARVSRATSRRARGLEATFVESELYAAVEVLGHERFDLVTRGSAPSAGFPTSGAGPRWLPRCSGPAAGSTCATCIRCCGRPKSSARAGWSSSTRTSNGPSPPASTNRTPTPTASAVAEPVSYEWNHGLGEIVQAVLDAGLAVTRLAEHDEVDWPAYPWFEDRGNGHWAMPGDRYDRPAGVHARSAPSCRLRGGDDVRLRKQGWSCAVAVAIIRRFSGRRLSTGSAHQLSNRGPRRPARIRTQGTARHNRLNAPPGSSPAERSREPAHARRGIRWPTKGSWGASSA